MSGEIFLDASFWIAYRDERQELHLQASRIIPRLLQEHRMFLTTLPVVCEIFAHFSRSKIKRRVVADDLFDNPIVIMAELSTTDQREALDLLRSQPDKSYSLCDALSFVLMRRREISRVLAFDDHFRQFGGFEIVA